MAKKRRHNEARALPVRTLPRAGERLALEVAGVTQSISLTAADDLAGAVADEPRPGPDGGYWGLMLPPGCPRRALLLGLGGGTVAHLLARRCPQAILVGVEHDATVLAVGLAEFGLDALPGLRIVEADAFAWVAAQVAMEGEQGSYDLICLDLFQAGKLVAGTLATAFLRQLAVLLAPEGTLTINLMVTGRTPEQIHRLRRVFVITRELRQRGNLVVHARRLASDEALNAGEAAQ